jgi:hypothetical protein
LATRGSFEKLLKKKTPRGRGELGFLNTVNDLCKAKISKYLLGVITITIKGTLLEKHKKL